MSDEQYNALVGALEDGEEYAREIARHLDEEEHPIEASNYEGYAERIGDTWYMVKGLVEEGE